MRSEALERWLTRHNFPHNDPVGVNVGFMAVVCVALEHLGRHPVRRSDLAMVISVELLLISRQPEIAQLHRLVVAREQDVLWLEVLVDDMHPVKVDHSGDDLRREAL